MLFCPAIHLLLDWGLKVHFSTEKSLNSPPKFSVYRYIDQQKKNQASQVLRGVY